MLHHVTLVEQSFEDLCAVHAADPITP